MRYLSVCSGIEAATVAWHDLGWDPWAFSEVDAFPSSVLAHHYPNVPNLGDMTRFQEWPDANVDVLVGGTPCQSFSVAGLRKGLDDPRGNLMLTFGAIARRYRPEWLVWENVPGVLSSKGGRDFGSFLGLLAELGYGFAYRVLDAQYFGVAQRRRRVFVVGHARDWRRAAAVLLERASLRGDPAPRRKAREGAAGGIGEGTGKRGGPAYCASTLNAAFGSKQGLEDQHALNGAELFVPVTHSLRADGFDASEDGTGRGTPLVPVHAFDARQSDVIQYGDRTGPLDTDGFTMAVAIHDNQRTEITLNDTTGALNKGGGKPGQGYSAVAVNLRGREGGAMPELDDLASIRAASGGSSRSYVQAMQVRRLTPRECERLQGFPDDYTMVPHRGKPAADDPRYKALGNSMAVPVMRWIGQRIAMVNEL